MFSVHPNRKNIGTEAFYAKGWVSYKSNNTVDVALVARSFCVSPITWKDGWRGKKRFLAANWIGLDFDTGTSLADATEAFGGITHVIGTTKHHGIAKGDSPACDRFRVFARLQREVTDVEEYEATVRHYAQKHKADLAAVDAARKFNPCKEIVSICDGIFLPLAAKRPERPLKCVIEDRKIPAWILRLLQNGVDGPNVSRNTTCYKIGLHLTRAKYSIREIADLIMDSPIPVNQHVRAEVERAISRGANQA